MNLFELKDYVLIFSPQALSLKPFKDIWNADKTKNKEHAINELSLIYYMADHRSDYSDICNEEDRLKTIVENIQFKKGYKVPKRIFDAIEFYRSRSETTSSRLLDVAKLAVRKIENHIRTVTLDDKNLKTIYSSVTDLSSLSESIDKLEEQIRKQQDKKSNARGSIEKADLEDGI